MKHKLFSFLLVLVALLQGSTIGAFADNYNGYLYSIVYGNKVKIESILSHKSGDIVIPGTINGYTVVEIAANVFEDNDELTSVTIPGTIATLGEKVFYDCDKLATVIFEENNSLKVIPVNFCGQCTKLTTLDISNVTSLTTISNDAFYRNSLTSLTIPGNVTYIGNDAFDVQGNSNDIKTVTFLPGSSETVVNYDDANFKSAETVTLCRNIKNDGSAGTSYIFPVAKNITLGGNLTTLETYTFHDADYVATINAQWTDPNTIPTLTGSASSYFDDTTPSSITLNVPACTEPAYKAKNVWNGFGSITSAGITSYSRDITGKTWGTVVVPFAIASSDNVKLYNVKAVDLTNSTITLESVENVAANTPCFFRNAGNVVTMTLSGETYTAPSTMTPIVTVSDNYNLIGSYYEQSIAPDDEYPNYYLSNGSFWKGSKAFTLGANRAYLKATTASGARDAFTIVVDDTAVISELQNVGTSEHRNYAKYIENGRMVIMKNGKKYDANGQLLK